MLQRILRYFYSIFILTKEKLFGQPDIGENILSKLDYQIQQGLTFEHARNISDELKVHEFRKAVKRSRSLLRVLKSRIPDKSYHNIDELLGNSAHDLSYPRESTVNLYTFMDLCLNDNNHLSPEIINQVRTYLANEVLEAYSNEKNRIEELLNSSFKLLFNAHFQVNGLKLNTYTTQKLNSFLDKTYFKGRKLFEASFYSADTEILHEWRRYAKHLLFQLKFTPHGYHSEKSDYLTKLERITDSLGKDHDLAIMEEFIEMNISIDPEELKQLKLAIMKVRSLMQKKAFKLGNQLYSEKSLQDYLYPVASKTLT